ESHGPDDFDLMLMTEFKDLATMEANQDKREAVGNQALKSNDKKMIEGYQERASWREIIGSRLAREIILEPKKEPAPPCIAAKARGIALLSRETSQVSRFSRPGRSPHPSAAPDDPLSPAPLTSLTPPE